MVPWLLQTRKVSIRIISTARCSSTARWWLPLDHSSRGWFWFCRGGCEGSSSLTLARTLRSIVWEKSQYHLAVAGGCEAFLCVTSVELCGSVVLMVPNYSTTETRSTRRMQREKL